MRRFILSLIAVIAVISAGAATKSQAEIAGELARRLFGNRADVFMFEEIAPLKNTKSKDVYTVESRGDKIVIGGNNANSMAAGLNYYL